MCRVLSVFSCKIKYKRTLNLPYIQIRKDWAFQNFEMISLTQDVCFEFGIFG